MKKIIIIIIIIVVILLLWLNGYLKQRDSSLQQVAFSYPTVEQLVVLETEEVRVFELPLDKTNTREIKKGFGTYITPSNSPIQPERFTGYHTGVDFEITADELEKEVVVKAICTGQLKLKQYGSGYGGYIVQQCQLENEPISVVYGHLKLSSISAKAGDELIGGEVIGILGAANSQETDFERKHLHLSIYKGNQLNTRGYVGSESELTKWLDPCLYICAD